MTDLSPLDVGLTISENSPNIDVARLTGLLQRAAIEEQHRGEIGLWICSDDEIADLHLRFMNIPGPTDVLSFAGDYPYLGDVAVSYETACRQANEMGHPVLREIAYLALHGFLHLVGYDDLTDDDQRCMLARQDELITTYEALTSDDWL